MELFDDDYKPLQLKEHIYESSEELEDAYDPVMIPHEVLPDTMGNTNVMHLNYDLDPLHRYQTLQKSV